MSRTSGPLTDRDLEEMEGRCGAATPGPWAAAFYGSGQANVEMPRGRAVHFGTVYGTPGIAKSGELGVPGHELDGLTEEEYAAQRAADAEFIASARTDIPRLIAALRASRESAACPVCLGQPHPSGKPCICGGTNRATDAFSTLHLEYLKSQERVGELEGALRPFAERVEQWYSDIREGGSRVPEGHELVTFEAHFTMADCEVARAALSPKERA